MRRQIRFLLFLANSILFLFPDGRADARENRAPVISRITIRGTDIFDFDTNPYLRRFPYLWINALHIQTRDSVFRQELLFKVGDRMDPFLVRETERNLRALSFVRNARIVSFPQRDGTVALVVHVNDSWTTEPQINLGGVNRVDDLEIGFKEKNFLGFGKTLEFFYTKEPDLSQRQYAYIDPQFLNTRFEFRTMLISRTRGLERHINLDRPFFSADTPWSVRSSHAHFETTIDEFDNNVRISEFEQTKSVGEAYGGLKIGGGRQFVNHLGLRYKKENQSYRATDKTAAGRGIPSGKEFQTFFLDFDSSRSRFIEMTRLEKMTRIEDINLGPSLFLSPGFSPGVLTNQVDTTQLDASYEQKKFLRGKHFFMGRAAYSGRNTFKEPENETWEFKLKYYYRARKTHTLVTQNRVNWGHNLDPDNLIKLGSENGLRAYKRDGLVGNRSWLLNIEDRIFWTDELWSLVALGTVFFYDAGYVWSQGESISLSKVKSNIGAGLRIGLTRSSREAILRLDFAYRLQKDVDNDNRFVVAFGSEQAF